MLCGYCKEKMPNTKTLFEHWKKVGCPTDRPVWAKVLESKKQGHSGRKILAEAYPDLYPTEPMSEETKEALRALNEQRREAGIKMPKKRRL
jgi:hypothetical protein